MAQAISPNICRAVWVQKTNYVEMISMLFCVDPRSLSSSLSCSKSLQLFGYCSWTVGGHALKTMRERERERENVICRISTRTLKHWLAYCIGKSKNIHVILTVWLSSLAVHNWATNISTAKSFAISAAACDPSGNCSVPTAAARHIKPNSWPQPDARWNPCCQPMCPSDLCHPFHAWRFFFGTFTFISADKYIPGSIPIYKIPYTTQIKDQPLHVERCAIARCHYVDLSDKTLSDNLLHIRILLNMLTGLGTWVGPKK